MNQTECLPGNIFLIPVGLGGENPKNLLPEYNSQVIKTLDEFVVENIRSARRFLRSMGYTKDFEKVIFHVLDKQTPLVDIPGFLANVIKGKNLDYFRKPEIRV
jgi:16S rRNA (cytidine1402-2'-O)-methyltransferase